MFDDNACVYLHLNNSVVIDTIETNWNSAVSLATFAARSRLSTMSSAARSQISEQIFQAICEENFVDLIYTKRIRNMIYNSPFLKQTCLMIRYFASREDVFESLQEMLGKNPVWKFKVLASEYVDRDKFLWTYLEHAKREQASLLKKASKSVNEVHSEESSYEETGPADDEETVSADEEDREKDFDEVFDVLPTMTSLNATSYQGMVSQFAPERHLFCLYVC